MVYLTFLCCRHHDYRNSKRLPIFFPIISRLLQEWGWEVFQSIEKYCRTQYGYGSLKNVNNPNSVEDRMESFFMAETLKYLYLLFDPDSEIDILNKHVFNTEAHPVKIFSDVATM